MDDATRARMEALEARLQAKRRAAEPEPSRIGQGYSGAELAYRMVIELVCGLLIGIGMGYGLDVTFGTSPWFLVPFTLLGFAAGVNVMLRTAKEIGSGDAPGETNDGEIGDPDGTPPDGKG